MAWQTQRLGRPLLWRAKRSYPAYNPLPLGESELSLYAPWTVWQPSTTIAVCSAGRTGSSKKRPTPSVSGFEIDMTSFDVLLMVVDFLFLSTSTAFVFSNIKEYIKLNRQKTRHKILLLLFYLFVYILIPITLYYVYTWFMEIKIWERIDFYFKFYISLRDGAFWGSDV